MVKLIFWSSFTRAKKSSLSTMMNIPFLEIATQSVSSEAVIRRVAGKYLKIVFVKEYSNTQRIYKTMGATVCMAMGSSTPAIMSSVDSL